MSDPGAPLSGLIAEHLDGTLSESQRREFNQLLQNSPAARAEFAAALRHDVLLGEVLREAEVGQTFLSAGDTLSHFWSRGAVAIAAAILFAATLLIFFISHNDPAAQPALATIQSVVGEVVLRRGSETIPVASGTTLRAQDRLSSGDRAAVILRYRDRTSLTLAENSVVTFNQNDPNASKKIVLENGALEADVAPQLPGAPMILTTADSEATVLGTRFRLYTKPGQSTLQVEHGRVRFARKADQQSVEVAAGNRATIYALTASIDLRPIEYAPPPDATAALPDAAPVPKDNRSEVLLVTAAHTPSFAHDVAIKSILEDMQFKVTEKIFSDITPQDAQGKALLVIPSHLCLGTRIFSEAAVPIIAWHSVWFEDLGMADPAHAKNEALKPLWITFPRPAHPLAAGLKFSEGPARFPIYDSCQPGSRAQIIAALGEQPSQAVLFAYETGEVMYAFTARARRVAFSIDVRESDGRDAPADAAKRLFIAAVNWCARK